MNELRVGIVGSGIMGQEIGKFLTEFGFPVLLKGRKEKDLQEFLNATEKILNKKKKFHKVGEEAFLKLKSNIVATTVFDDRFSDLDIIIEAVVEDLPVKQSLFKEIEKRCSEKTVICTNTSTLSVEQLSQPIVKKDRFLGLHFFHPFRLFKFLEIIPGKETSKASIDVLMSLVKGIERKGLFVKDSTAFFFNRIMMSNLIEIVLALESGWFGIEELDQTFKKSDFMLGLISAADHMGLDLIKSSVTLVSQSFPERYTLPEIITKLNELGRFGKKNQKGFYAHDGRAETVDDEVKALLEGYKAKRSATPYPFSPEVGLARILSEAIYCLSEGIIVMDDAEEVITTVPPFCFTKGLYKYMDKMGLDTLLSKLQEYEKTLGKRYKPAPLLVEMVKKGDLGEKTGKGFFTYQTS